MTDLSQPKPQGILLTLWRGIQTLEAIARSGGRATARELSEDTGVNIGTCYQIVRTLNELGYVSRLPGGRYALGPRVRFLVEHYDVKSAAPVELLSMLDDLHGELNDTSYLAIRTFDSIMLIAAREGTRPLRVSTVNIGHSGALHARASCKAVLAFLEEATVRDIFRGKKLTAYTPQTITDVDDLFAELKRTRELGYATDVEEVDPEVAHVAVPIFDGSGEPFGAYAVGVAAASLPDRLTLILEALHKAGRAASEALGFSGPYPPSTQ